MGHFHPFSIAIWVGDCQYLCRARSHPSSIGALQVPMDKPGCTDFFFAELRSKSRYPRLSETVTMNIVDISSNQYTEYNPDKCWLTFKLSISNIDELIGEFILWSDSYKRWAIQKMSTHYWGVSVRQRGTCIRPCQSIRVCVCVFWIRNAVLLYTLVMNVSSNSWIVIIPCMYIIYICIL